MEQIVSAFLYFVLVLGILVTVHEFGHFWVAKKLGVKVLRFSVGFGKALYSKCAGKDNTEYVIAAIPLGGYVKMLDEAEGDVPEEELHRAFNRQPLLNRSAIVIAGPLFNFILAILVYWLVFIIGAPGLKPIVGIVDNDTVASQAGFQEGDLITHVSEQDVKSWDSVILLLLDSAIEKQVVEIGVTDSEGRLLTRSLDLSVVSSKLGRGTLLENLGVSVARPHIAAVIGKVLPDGAADRAGMQKNDLVMSVNGKNIIDWADWVAYIRDHPGQDIATEVSRNGNIISLVVTPATVKAREREIGQVGAIPFIPEGLYDEYKTVEKFPPVQAFFKAAKKFSDMTALTFSMLWQMAFGDISIANISGPISIAQYAGYSASIGVATFLGFLALISISLGVLNLLPIPLLDGGHLLYYVIEAVKGSPVSEKGQMLGQKVGIAFLVILMCLAFYNDIVHLFG